MTRHGTNRLFYQPWDDLPRPAALAGRTREEKVHALAEELSRFFQHAAIKGDMWPETADVVRKIQAAGL